MGLTDGVQAPLLMFNRQIFLFLRRLKQYPGTINKNNKL